MIKLIKLLIYSLTFGIVLGAATVTGKAVHSFISDDAVSTPAVSHELSNSFDKMLELAFIDVIEPVPVRIAEPVQEMTNEATVIKVKNKKDSKARVKVKCNKAQLADNTQTKDDCAWVIHLPEIIVRATIEPLAIQRHRSIAKIELGSKKPAPVLVASTMQLQALRV
jgi:hypothetical protein